MISELQRDASQSKETASADSPVFIVGLGRGGTTLLSRMLDAHSNIAILPETWWYVVLDRLGCCEEFKDLWQTSLFFNEVWGNLKSYHDPAARILAGEASKEPRYVGPTARVLENLGRAYAKERNARIWGEKTPGHALWLPQIRDLFPRARMLFMMRDPRDVLVSYDDRWNGGRRDTSYLVGIAALLKFYLVHLLYQTEFPLEQVHWVKYEALTAQPAAELGEVCSFLGVDFEPSMLAFHEQHQNVKQEMAEGHHHRLLAKPATTSQVGRYRQAFSSSQIALVERLLAGGDARVRLSPFYRKQQYLHRARIESLQKSRAVLQPNARRRFSQEIAQKWQAEVAGLPDFGRALDLVPSWRVATTQRDWRSLAEGFEKPEGAPSPPEESPSENPIAGPEKLSFQTEMGRISRQSGIVFAGTIFTAALGYVFKVYLARVAGRGGSRDLCLGNDHHQFSRNSQRAGSA